MTRAELESMIEEELIAELQQKQKKPSREELLDLIAAVDKESQSNTNESFELDEKMDNKYQSAGSVMNKLDREMTDAQKANREQVGKKIIDAIQTDKKNRTRAQASLRKALIASMKKGPQPGNNDYESAKFSQKLNSFAWALATDYAIKRGGSFDIEKRVDKKYRAQNRADKRKQTEPGAEEPRTGSTATGAEKEPQEKPTGTTPAAPSSQEPKAEPTGKATPTAKAPAAKPAPSTPSVKKEPTAEPEKPTPTVKRPKMTAAKTAPSVKKEPTAEPEKPTPTVKRPKMTAAKTAPSAPSAKKEPSTLELPKSSNRYSGLTADQKKKLTSIIRANKEGDISKKDAIELMNKEMEKISGISRRSNQYTGLEPIDRFRLASITKNLRNKDLSPAEKERLQKIKASIQKKAKTARGKNALKEYAKYIIKELNNPSLNEQHTNEHVFMAHVLYEIITALGEQS